MRRETGSPKILESGNGYIPELRVLALTKRHVGSGNEIGAAGIIVDILRKTTTKKLNND